MQIFVFLQPMWRQERSGLSDSGTLQPQGIKQEKHEKKHEIFAFKLLLEEIQLKNLTIRKIFKKKKNTCCRILQKWSEIELYPPPMVLSKIFDRSI